MTLRTFSYGGGVQSTAALVLAAEGRIDFPIFLFANTGDDSEHPATLEYVRTVAVPYAAANGIELHILDRVKRDGTVETLYGRLTRPGIRAVDIPVRMDNGSPGNRNCTGDFKIKVIAKWQKQHGATPEAPAVCGLGISVDEVQRARTSSGVAWQTLEYPLLDLNLSRQDCRNVIERGGLPVPPKSACWFCPFKRIDTWRDMKRDEPDLFERSVELERHLNTTRERIGKDPVFFTRFGVPLDRAVGEGVQGQFDFDGPDTCDEGVCFV